MYHINDSFIRVVLTVVQPKLLISVPKKGFVGPIKNLSGIV